MRSSQSESVVGFGIGLLALVKQTLTKRAAWRGSLPVLAVTVLVVCSAQAVAQFPNLALNKPLVDESSEWLNAGQTPNRLSQFNGSHITDGIVCESDQKESGTNPAISSFWIGAEGKLNQTLTIDLGAPTKIREIHLRNTHNAQFNDRNTMDFQIEAANHVQVCSDPEGFRTITTLVHPVTILMGTLASVDGITCPNEIPPEIFNSSSGLNTGGNAFRYLQFTAINCHPGKVGVGLNELEVYGSQ